MRRRKVNRKGTIPRLLRKIAEIARESFLQHAIAHLMQKFRAIDLNPTFARP